MICRPWSTSSVLVYCITNFFSIFLRGPKGTGTKHPWIRLSNPQISSIARSLYFPMGYTNQFCRNYVVMNCQSPKTPVKLHLLTSNSDLLNLEIRCLSVVTVVTLETSSSKDSSSNCQSLTSVVQCYFSYGFSVSVSVTVVIFQLQLQLLFFSFYFYFS